MFNIITSIKKVGFAATGRWLTILTLMVAIVPALRAQKTTAATACAIKGIDSLPGGTVASYSLSGCRASSWRLSCGTISAQTDSSVTISLNAAACASITLTALQGANSIATKQLKIGAALAVNGGAITMANQTVPADSLPKLITASAATQGICNGVYSYQWYRSTDSIHFQLIPDATGRHYQPGAGDSTIWLKRQTTCGTSAVFTNTVTIHVNPRLNPGTISPGVQMLNPDTIPGALSLSGVSGGGGSYVYQWQSAGQTQPRVWHSISGATVTSYPAPAPDSATHYRVRISSKGDTAYSAEAVIGVYPPLSPGTLSPAAQTIAVDSLPASLNLEGMSGGNGAFTYQWYSSADGASWSPMQGVIMSEYWPGGGKVTTYYRVAVTSNGMTAISNSVLVAVNPATTSISQ